MLPKLSSETKAVWELVHTWRRAYPFWAITSTRMPVPALIKNPGPFGRYYRMTYDNNAYWAFKEEVQRDAFVQHYGAQSWNPSRT